MAETAVASAIEFLLQQLIAVSSKEIRDFKHFKKDLQKLKNSAAMIRNFLEDAETKVVAEKSVQCWLGKLEDVAFDADYVFDEVSYHVLRKEVQKGIKMKKKVRCFFPNCKSFSFRHRMARKINDIVEKIKSIDEEATGLGLQRRIESAPARGVGTGRIAYRETDSVNTDRVFVGREDDATKLVEMVKNSPTEGAAIEFLLKQLIAVSTDEIRRFKHFRKDLQKLKDSTAMILDFLEDAEKKVVTDNKAVTRWLRKLEDVAFNADYVFDEVSYHVLRKEVQRGINMKKKVRFFFPNCKSFSFRHRMARKINDIVERMKSIDEDAKRLGLKKGIESAPARGVKTDGIAYRETDSVNTDRVFVGREDDEKTIVEMVKNCPTENKLSVIPIVGMGGLGKTTLAKKVFNDEDMKSGFQKRIWVYVSENFVPGTVFKSVFESLTGKKIDESREVVLRKLREEISDKRYLLVLDDVWNEDPDKWDNFFTPLEAISPPKGNVILLTTRNKNVASVVKTNDIHELRGLSHEHCWSIIKDIAKKDSVSSEVEIIGRKIAEKCGGLPLAAKVAGGLLRGKSEDKWRSIEEKWLLDNGENPNNVSKILKLSFDNLPSPRLKKCFAFCSFIPKGWWTEKDEMIHMWMADGLLQTDQETDMEVLGNTVFNILVQSSLLQVKWRDSYGNVINFEMHDLVHDLASCILNPKSHEEAHEVRYISKTFGDESSLILREDAKCLRGLFFNGKICHAMLSNLKRLHVLILNDIETKELPVEIGKLICLRFLDILHTKIEGLPDSIGNLYHLQTLRAVDEYSGYGCLRKLPHTLKFLLSLRHLCIPNIELPPEIGKLTKLQTLPYFKVRNEDGCKITELGSLKNLKGTIELHNLENVRDKEEATTSDIFHKVNILKLKLVWNESREDEGNNDENVLEGLQPHQFLESLIIEGFKGSSFPSWTLRMAVNVEDCWMRLDNLIEITLSNCRVCEEIPMMGHLPHLKALYLRHLPNVKCLGSSFYGIEEEGVNKETMMVVFPTLEKLELIEMESLSSWTEVELRGTQSRKVSIFPHLEYLKIYRCRQLKSAPSHFPCLKELEIDEMESYIPLASICGSKLTSLLKLKIRDVIGLVCLPEGLFSSNRDLLELEIGRCEKLSYLVRCLGGGGASLRKLEIWNCKDFEKFPDDLHKLNALEELSIYDCPNVKSIAYPSGTQLSSQGFTSLRHLKFQYCSGLTNLPLEILESCDQTLEILSLGGSSSLTNLPQVMSIMHKMSRLRVLGISGFPNLGDVILEIGSLGSIEELWIGGCGDYDCVSLDRILPAFPSLRKLYLIGMMEWDGLPDQLQHLTTLQSLWLIDFGIKVLPEWLASLSSLTTLYLFGCENLRHLPSKKAMQGLTRLNYLHIYGCPLLKQNLEEDRSDDSEWSKITHIPKIKVDWVNLKKQMQF